MNKNLRHAQIHAVVVFFVVKNKIMERTNSIHKEYAIRLVTQTATAATTATTKQWQQNGVKAYVRDNQ